MRIAVSSPKGGSGRTTLVLNLGVTLSERGLRVVLVDLDPQGGLGFHIARKDHEWAGVSDFLMGRVTLDQAVKRSNRTLLSMLPRGRLDPRDVCEFERALCEPGVLASVLKNLDRRFDVVLMDLPAGLGMIPRGALGVATHAVLTVSAETAAVRALPRMFTVLEEVRTGENEGLDLLAVLPTMVGPDSETALGLFEDMNLPVYAAGIPHSPMFRVAAEMGKPLNPDLEEGRTELKSIRGLASLIHQRLRDGAEGVSPVSFLSDESRGRLLGFNAQRFSPKGTASVNRDAPGRDGAAVSAGHASGPSSLDEWRAFLGTCLKATGSETAFVMDSQGLTLTSRGRLHSGEIEAMGTRLMIAFEQASSMDIAAGEVRTLLVEFDRLWLTGLRADGPAGRSFTVGLLGREPVGPSARGHIRDCLGALKNSEEPLAIPIEL